MEHALAVWLLTHTITPEALSTARVEVSQQHTQPPPIVDNRQQLVDLKRRFLRDDLSAAAYELAKHELIQGAPVVPARATTFWSAMQLLADLPRVWKAANDQ